MKRLPTDIEILSAIYSRYYKTFTSYSDKNKDRGTKTFVPIDIEKIGNDLGVDGDIVFGRLYYYLEQKYSYERNNGSAVSLFILNDGRDIHCVNFPYLASVLATLKAEDRKFKIADRKSVV